MKNITTSYYARNGHHPDAYAISVYGPEWYEGKSLPFLAPPKKLVMDYKKGLKTTEEYTEEYILHITRNNQTAQDLYNMLPDDAILLCYETVSEFCHRRVFANWIKQELGIDIPEILSEEEQLDQQQQVLVDYLLNFE